MDNQDIEKLEQRIDKYFGKLSNNVGKKIRVDYVHYGSPESEESTLKNVRDYVNIEIESSAIPFIGYGSAIQRIISKDGEVLYENPLVPRNYDLRKDKEIDKLRELSFGQNVADRFRQQRIKERIKNDERVRKLNEEARSNLEKYLTESSTLVRKDRVKEWKKYVKKNTQDFYSEGVIDASIRAMKVLSEGKTPEEAEKEIYEMGITGYQEGLMAETIAYFHPRGDEFRQYWNRQFVGKKEAERIKGVVNPAIPIMKQKE